MELALKRLLLFCGTAFVFDLAFFGPGLTVPGIGVSARRLLFVAMVCIAAVLRMLAGRWFSRSEIVLLIFLLILVIGWCLVIPVSYGYFVSQGFADVAPWLTLVALVVWPWAAWPDITQWVRFRHFIVILSIILALAHIAIWALLWTGVIPPAALAVTANLIGATDADADGFIKVALVGNGQYRVYWSSSVFLLASMYFLIAYRPMPVRAAWLAALLLIIFALWTTHIRAFIGAIAIFALFGVLLRRASSRRAAVSPRLKVLFFWMAGILAVCIAINPAVLEFLNLSRDVSDVERTQQASALAARFFSHPTLGTGFGSYVSQIVRSDSPFSYELVFYALTMKLGVLGICVLLAILFLSLGIARISTLARVNPRLFATWLAFTTGFWFAGATNPFVTNFAGMTLVVLMLVDARFSAQVEHQTDLVGDFRSS